mgnify:CR=1 FL=1
MEFIQGLGDTTARFVYVGAIHQGCRLPPAAAGAIGNSREHFKVPQQNGDGGFRLRRLFMDCPACFQKQRRLLQDPVPHLRRRIAPGCIQFPGFTAAELVGGKSSRHSFAVFNVGARQRNQILHGHMRRYLSLADLLLDRIRKQFHESKAAGDPTDAPVKLPCQFIKAVSETMFQFGQQPALFQRARAFGCSHRLLEHKSFGFVHRPNGCRYRIAAQLLQSGNAFVAVDHQVSFGLIPDGHNNDRHLLP